MLQRTTGNETHENNGVYWYFAFDADMNGRSFGFSRVPRVRLQSADCLGCDNDDQVDGPADEDGRHRLSWHTDGDDGGFRVGHWHGYDVDDEDANAFDGSKLLYWTRWI